MKKCEICKEAAAKYRCPRCNIETCCLQCVNQHKVKLDCNGQRDKTAFVKLDDFTDMQLLNDYRFLEDCGRKVSSTGRDDLKRERRKPYFVRDLQKQAMLRNIDLEILPYPMSRRKHNSTQYQPRSKKILWHIEWIFPQIEVTVNDKRVCEDTILRDALVSHWGPESDPIIRHKLKLYISTDCDNLAVFMKQEKCSGGQSRFYRLDLANTISENLQNKYLVEYPVFHVVQKDDWEKYPTDQTRSIDVSEADKLSTSRVAPKHLVEKVPKYESAKSENNVPGNSVT